MNDFLSKNGRQRAIRHGMFIFAVRIRLLCFDSKIVRVQAGRYRFLWFIFRFWRLLLRLFRGPLVVAVVGRSALALLSPPNIAAGLFSSSVVCYYACVCVCAKREGQVIETLLR